MRYVEHHQVIRWGGSLGVAKGEGSRIRFPFGLMLIMSAIACVIVMTFVDTAYQWSGAPLPLRVAIVTASGGCIGSLVLPFAFALVDWIRARQAKGVGVSNPW